MWFLRLLNFIGKTVIVLCVLFWIMVPIISSSKCSHSSDSSEFHSSRPYNRYQKNQYRQQKINTKLYEDRKKQEMSKAAKKYSKYQKGNPTGISPVRTVTNARTPEDAEAEGYSDGYEQGVYDRENGYSLMDNYDDGTNYYGYYETKYQEGYADGYEAGFNGY